MTNYESIVQEIFESWAEMDADGFMVMPMKPSDMRGFIKEMADKISSITDEVYIQGQHSTYPD